jgi:5,10-methylenetetrahydromethanopterin reductase
MRFGLSVDGGDAPQALRSIVAAAETIGVSNLWIASHLFAREPVACAAAALAASRNVGVVLMAMSPYAVHPVYATMAAATLDEFFPGRVKLCYGMGAPRDLEDAGIVAEQPLRTLREALEISRRLFSGEIISFKGERYHVAGRRLATPARQVPLWLAASGPRMLELAGEIADGVVISAGTSAAFVRASLDHVRSGEKRRNRTIEKASLVFCSVDQNERVAHDRVRRRLAHVLRGGHHARNLELAGTKLDQSALAHAFAREDWGRVEALITDDVVHRHCVSGTSSGALAALADYRAAGLDEIVIHGAQDGDQVMGMAPLMRPKPAAAPISHTGK